MPIVNDFLSGADRITELGNGSSMSPTKIVLHYTAGSSLSGAIETLRDRGLSYNVLIDKDGSVHQARAFNRSAGHAGRSNWKAGGGLTNASSLNTSSIGISMVNLGLHDFFRNGKWWYGFDGGEVQPPNIADEDANKLSSIYMPNRRPHWDPYPEAQVAACHEVVREIVNHYPDIEEIVGHDDIAIDDKFDPGPALPVQEWRKEFGKEGPLGLAAKVNSPDGELNMRDRAIHNDGTVIAVLNQGDEVHVRSVTYAGRSSAATLIRPERGRALTGWASIDTDRSNKHAGFVYLGYLTANPLAAQYAAAL